jgi:hypothetical protein
MKGVFGVFPRGGGALSSHKRVGVNIHGRRAYHAGDSSYGCVVSLIVMPFFMAI